MNNLFESLVKWIQLFIRYDGCNFNDFILSDRKASHLPSVVVGAVLRNRSRRDALQGRRSFFSDGDSLGVWRYKCVNSEQEDDERRTIDHGTDE